MHEQEIISLLALLKIDGVGDIVAKKLLNHCGNAQEIGAKRCGESDLQDDPRQRRR